MKSILFNTEMVRALQDGRKSVTRRAVKPQHLRVLDSPYHKEHPETPDKVLLEKLCEPPYRPGDILYVRETWQRKRGGGYLYKADTASSFDLFITPDGCVVNKIPWCPSIHMPKEAARIFLRVTGVRVERLRPMLPCDIQKEGCPYRYSGFDEEQAPDYEGWMRKRWDSTIKKADLPLYGWGANPWVWVIEFERISKEEALKNEQ